MLGQYFLLLTLSAFQWFHEAVADPPHEQLIIGTVPLNLDNATGSEERPYRVAIIGAGAAGSSAAWWLHLGATRQGKTVLVDVYERSDYVGGREFCPAFGRDPLLTSLYRKHHRISV